MCDGHGQIASTDVCVCVWRFERVSLDCLVGVRGGGIKVQSAVRYKRGERLKRRCVVRQVMDGESEPASAQQQVFGSG